MRPRHIAASLTAVAIAAVLVLVLRSDDGDSGQASADDRKQPSIELVSPRNGSRQENRAVVVRVELENFRLAPENFGGAPELGEGHIRFSLNRVPDCIEEEKLQRAINSPLGSGRLIGASFDYPQHSGPNGVLAEQIGSQGLYSPSTTPEIYYERLPPGFYRLTINLALNNGVATPYNAATNFEVLADVPGDDTAAGVSTLSVCEEGLVSSAEAAKAGR